ncbi:MAG: choice-of-anchor B family protein [Bacteroidetes bacterium]|nr:choice-of-anchor B family protein [Bacteroidota bacterium]
MPSFPAFSQPYNSQNITLFAKWDTSITIAEPTYGIRYNSVWGWVDPQDNREYAIIGSTDGTYFIEVTDPSNPAVRDYVAGRRDSCIWREYKTYQNYCYMVSDDNSPNSMQIYDLSPLPDSVQIVHDADTIIKRAHTLFVDGDKMYFAIPKTISYGISVMAVYSLADPIAPALLRKLDDDFPGSDYVHDMFVRNDTVFASSSYSGLFVYKYNTGSNNFTLLGTLTSYFDQGYNHSSAWTPDGKTLIMTDEVPEGLSVKIADVSDLTDITVVANYYSHPGATPHNPFVIGNRWAVIAYYQDGLYILDISNPASTVMSGFFDTHPQNGDNNGYPSPAYMGNWGAYVDLPSGTILASDMQNGLFVLNASDALVGGVEELEKMTLEIFSNPSAKHFLLSLLLPTEQEIHYTLSDLKGKILFEKRQEFRKGNSIVRIPVHGCSAGIYFLKISGKDGIAVKKIVKISD